MAYWVGVVHADHVARGVELGIVQINHGSRAGVTRLKPGDGFVYYSPKDAFPDGAPLKSFTAIGVVGDREPWQATDGDFQPWRREIAYDESARYAPVAGLRDTLEFTRDNPNWGYQLRLGLIEISRHDFDVIAKAMGSHTLKS